MARTELEVRRVGPGETAAVAATLARAFEHDRVMRWLAPGDGRLERGFALYLERLWLVHDSCFSTDDGLAAACWLPPERWRLSAGQRVRLLPRLAAAATCRDLPRFATGVRAIEGRHPREPHWYLPVVGVEPSAQGGGRGSALLRHVLARCDADRTPAYLHRPPESRWEPSQVAQSGGPG